MDDCIRYKDRLHEWADGELVDGVAEEVDLHLSICPKCADTARAIEHMKLLIKAKTRRPRVPQGLQEKVKQAITVESAQRSVANRWTGRKLIPFASAAAFLLVILASINPFSPNQVQDLQASVGNFVFDSHQRSVTGDDGPNWFFEGSDEASLKISEELGVPVNLPVPDATLLGVSFSTIENFRLAKVFYRSDAEHISVFIFPKPLGVEGGCHCIKQGKNFAVFCLPGKSVCYLFATSSDAACCLEWFHSGCCGSDPVTQQ